LTFQWSAVRIQLPNSLSNKLDDYFVTLHIVPVQLQLYLLR